METIHQKIGFKETGPLIYTHQLINEAKGIFEELPLKNLGFRQLVIEQNLIEETYAISTAEDSGLTLEVARKIEISSEIAQRLKKYRDNKALSDLERYEQLEFENIKEVEQERPEIGFQELTIELILSLHQYLTIGLDDYVHLLEVTKYHPGELRKSDDIRVGKIRKYEPPEARKVKNLLQELLREFKQKKVVHLSHIFEFHILFYALHPFQNGNKRVIRMIESMLLRHYGFGLDGALSMAVLYAKEKDYANEAIMNSLRVKEATPFINFALRGYLYSGAHLLMTVNINKYYYETFKKRLEPIIRQKTKIRNQEAFMKGVDAIMALRCEFTHGQFVSKMKEFGYTLGVSQEVLKFLKSEYLLDHEEGIYFIEKAREINRYQEKLEKFLFRNAISFGVFES